MVGARLINRNAAGTKGWNSVMRCSLMQLGACVCNVRSAIAPRGNSSSSAAYAGAVVLMPPRRCLRSRWCLSMRMADVYAFRFLVCV